MTDNRRKIDFLIPRFTFLFRRQCVHTDGQKKMS